MQVPEEEKFLNTEAELHAMLVGLLAGRAAEEIVFDTVTTGASNDIEKATSIARAMVTQYGMSKKFGLIGLQTIESQYLEGRAVMNCSDVTAAEVDSEVMRILKECYDEALTLLRENRTILDKIAAYLIEKETITGKEFMKIYRKEKGIPEPEKKPEENRMQNPAEQPNPPQGAPQMPSGQEQGFGTSGPQQEDSWWNKDGSGIPEQNSDFWEDDNGQDDGPQQNGTNPGGGNGQDGQNGQNRPQGPVGRFSNTALPPSDQMK